MSSVYPNAPDNLPTVRNSGDLVGPDALNHAAAVNKLEAELGLTPKGSYASVAARLAALELPTIENQTATAYTLVLADALGVIVNLVNAAAITLTIPPNSSVAFPVGSTITVRQGGAGQVTISPGTGVTICSRGNANKLAGQFAYATLIKSGTPDTWDLFGDTTV